MPKNTQEERLRWVKMVENSNTKLKDIIEICPYSGRTLKRWLKEYREKGETGLIPKSTRPKSNPKESPIQIKERVIGLRKKTKLCALKLKWKLEKEGVEIHERTIGKILKNENLVRKYRIKKIKYKYIKALRQPGELIEIDVKNVPGTILGRKYYQYTAIDTASRWRYLKVYDEYTSHHSICFLQEVIKNFPHKIQAVKTDNGSIFTNYYIGLNKRSDMTMKTPHALDMFCASRNIIHYLIDPGKPAQNGTVERSHREDQEKFYEQNIFRSFSDLQHKIRNWNEYYNNLEHCGLNGKTPNEMLRFKVTNVCA